VKAPIALAGGEAASAPDCALHFFMGPLLSTFELTIQNTANRQVRNLFLKVSWLYLSRFPWLARAAAALAAAALAVRNRNPWP
jgi:hypothetical protein